MSNIVPAAVRWLAPWLLAVAGGCSTLLAPPPAAPLVYTLDGGSAAAVGAGAARAASGAAAALAASAPTLSINPPRAAAGHDSRDIVYIRTAQQQERYARSEWVDTPSRMLAPLLVTALDGSGAFRAVVLAPSAAAGDLRLDTEIVRLQQDFSGAGNSVRLTLRATFVDSVTRRVLAAREFDHREPAATADAYGGVQAAQRAVQAVLAEISALAVQVAREPGLAPR